ncbi:MAG TPA: hypothetical protein VMV94_16460 [Phycisphaerae bacterium]|nr:hypothetical protein [Phycisphaerae bacterium]
MITNVWSLSRYLATALPKTGPGGLKPAVRVILLGVLTVATAGGCAGSGVVQFASLHPTEIDPPATTVWRMDAQQCYWWLDDAGELNVAMTCVRNNLLFSKLGRVTFDMSFVLGAPPAGSGRNYAIQQRETRSIFVSALQDLRLISSAGIVGVNMRDDGTLRGGFRTWMVPASNPAMSLSFLPQQTGPLLCFGTFRAVKDETRGKEIRARCEAGGWVRPPRKPPTGSQPAATQPSTSQPAATQAATSPPIPPR